MAPKATVRFTANFERNLSAIESYWREKQALQAFVQLVDELEQVVSMLESHPRLGRSFFARSPRSAEAADWQSRLRRDFGDFDVREYLAGDYLMLYAFESDKRPPVVHMLAVCHHLQLSFDFDGYWASNREPTEKGP